MSQYQYRARVKRVVDGDTMDLWVDLGFTVFVEIRVRLAGIDTPETYGVKKDSEEYQKGIQAKEFVQKWVDDREREVYIETEKGTGKYGRWIARILDAPDGDSLNDALVESGNARVVEY